jgi:hypothetical protein
MQISVAETLLQILLKEILHSLAAAADCVQYGLGIDVIDRWQPSAIGH